LISGDSPFDFYRLVMQCLPDSTGKNKVHSFFTVEADEAEPSWPLIVVIVHDDSVLHGTILLKVPAQVQTAKTAADVAIDSDLPLALKRLPGVCTALI